MTNYFLDLIIIMKLIQDHIPTKTIGLHFETEA